jgi:hypothetical protein
MPIQQQLHAERSWPRGAVDSLTMIQRHPRTIGCALALAALLIGCSIGGGSVPSTPTPQTTATPLPFAPDEDPTPAGPRGRVTTQVDASCRLAIVDAEISAVYRASVTGVNSRLRRVRLLINNKLADDSGDIFATSYEGAATLHVSSGANYSLTVSVIATNATAPLILHVVRCPASPGPGA